MPHRSIRLATIVAGAALLISATALAACGSSNTTSSAASSTPAKAKTTSTAAAATTPASGGTTDVAVTLNEFHIKPAVASAPAGHVVFDVTNSGKVKHQFTIIRTSKSAATVLSKQEPNDDIPGARGEIASLAPGASKKLVIKKLKPGHYAMVCALPGHYQSGMYADFTVN